MFLGTSLFQGLFSVFDAFTGDLLTALYQRRPELLNRISKAMSLSDILAFKSFDELKQEVLRLDIERFRRKSYVEQFEELEETFGLKLRDFPKWPHFVECGQRRNLITHCDGLVTNQYIGVCRSQGLTFSEPPVIGSEIGIDEPYLLQSCELLMEVGLKLGHTLWRKVVPAELSEADKDLHRVTYDCLVDGYWHRAQIYAEFGLRLPKASSDLDRKVTTINLAIALKFSGNSEESIAVLAGVDWTGAALDFRLAEAVLLDKYDEASRLMRQIGKVGILVGPTAYHVWPLFRDFRATDGFREAYRQVYGHEFVAELQRAATVIADSASTDATAAPPSRAEES